MRIITCVLSVVAMMGAGLFTTVSTAHAKDALVKSVNNPGSFADLSQALIPAVVNVSSTQKAMERQQLPDMPQFPPGSPFEDFFEQFKDRSMPGMPSVPAAALGSGFVIDAQKGYIITNNHVVQGADEVRVTFNDDETLTAEVIGSDEKTDLAVLQVKTQKKLTAVSFGNSDVMRVGDWVLAIGNPFGLGGTVTAGIISARARDINAGPYDDFLQTDASINRGNSGGPMFDMNGKVIGINTAIFSPTGGSVGIGFAIPSALAQPVIKQIIEFGRTRRGWLGVRIQTVTDEIAESLGLQGGARGALVASVTQGSPAATAGLKVGDIILKFNGQDVQDMKSLPRLVAETPINKPASVSYWRGDKVNTVNVNIGELEKAEEEGLIKTAKTMSSLSSKSKGVALDELGIQLKVIDSALRDEYGISADVSGVMISEVSSGSEAAQKGILDGDVIMELNQNPVKTPADVQKAVDDARAKKKPSVLLLLNRMGDVRFLALRLSDKEKTEK